MTADPTRHEILFHRLAAGEYLRARRWYAKEGGRQLADRFRDEVDEAVQRIARSPEAWPVFRKAYRWVRVRRFPYLL